MHVVKNKTVLFYRERFADYAHNNNTCQITWTQTDVGGFYFDRLYIFCVYFRLDSSRASTSGLCGMETRCLCLLLVCVLSLYLATADNGSIKQMKMQYTGMPLLKFQFWWANVRYFRFLSVRVLIRVDEATGFILTDYAHSVNSLMRGLYIIPIRFLYLAEYTGLSISAQESYINNVTE